MNPDRIPLNPDQLMVRPSHLFGFQWMLLSAGDFQADHCNAMTIAWGALGAMWNKPSVTVYVRPQRYTMRFLERYPTFTLCAFPESCRPALQLLGSRSGQDLDKIPAAGLTPMASTRVAAPAYKEADLVIECCQMHRQHLTPDGFQSKAVAAMYPEYDYHYLLIAEIVAVSAAQRYHA